MSQGLQERAELEGAVPELPTSLTSFIGREGEIEDVQRLISSGRLVTITGMPGSGKTRLALEAAAGLATAFPDGITYTNLSSCVSRDTAEETLGQAIGLGNPSGGPMGLTQGPDARPTLDAIVDVLRGTKRLLVLDNAEHLVRDIGESIAQVLRSTDGVHFLVTSRLPLRLPGELVWQSPLLSVPAPGASLDEIRNSEAVQLFVDRATAVEPHFVLDNEIAEAVAEIARLLDGNPLAIELAAARVKVLDVHGLAARIAGDVDLLSGGSDDSVPHHKTLRAAIDWGYELLTPPEQILFGRLSVFHSPFTLEAAETVAAGDPIDRPEVLDLIGSLAEKSMVLMETAPDGTRRYRLSHNLRTYAQERLDEQGNVPELARRHATHMRSEARRIGPKLRSSLRVEDMRTLDVLHPDLIVAIEWALEHGDAEAALDFVANLYLFWFARRHRFALALCERALAMPEPSTPLVRAEALVGTGMLTLMSGDPIRSRDLLDEGMSLAFETDEPLVAAEAKMYLGLARGQAGDRDGARRLFTEARDTFVRLEEEWGVAWATWFLGTVELEGGDEKVAKPLIEEALEVFRKLNSHFGIANATSALGQLARSRGEPTNAIRYHEESLDLFKETNDQHGVAASHAALGIDLHDAGRHDEAAGHLLKAAAMADDLGNFSWMIELLYLRGATQLAAGDYESAASLFRAAIEQGQDHSNDQVRGAIKASIEGLAWVAAKTGHLERAITLFAAVDALADIETKEFFAKSAPDPSELLTKGRARLGSQLYQSLWSAGHSMSLADAMGLALAAPETDRLVDLPKSLSLEEIELGARVTAQLDGISERRAVRLAGIRVTGRRRRPTGERAPLERPLLASGWIWLAVGVSMAVLWFTLFAFPDTRNWWEARDLTVNRWFVDLRTSAATSVADAIHALGSPWFFRPLRWAMLIALVVFRRWRHLFGALILFIVMEAILNGLTQSIGRPRPFVEALAPWHGYSHPSEPVATLATTLTAIGFTLVPKGTWRMRYLIGATAVVTALVIARVYLGVDHLTDGVVGGLFGFAATVLLFRWFAPDSAFPVVYKRGRTAHLDISGARGDAIRKAVADQLGLEIISMEPFGLEGSGGSTPIRLKVAGDPETYLFAKLYSTNHLRADRWYKIGRTILYGALEDEVRFTSVRRLVEYEDYMLLRMKEAGVPSAQTYGFAEITPEREYLIVTEFLQDAEEITTAEIDDAVIDDALLMIRRLWDAGLAHRDVKPANVLVRDGQVRLIDVAFGTIRPSPWRQAVDLANMMIILGLRTSAKRVYERGLQFFAPADIAEAFAATRGVTIPTQSRSHLRGHRKTVGKDLVEEFRALAPRREPIAIQRWSPRRIGLALAAALGLMLLISIFIENLAGQGFI